MYFIWQLPGEPPHPDAIRRMREHFPQPQDPMPEAWSLGGQIAFYKDPDGSTDSEELCLALDTISSGVTLFSEVDYVPVWKSWFRYLLPDCILRANDPANFNDSLKNILAKTIISFFNIYPDGIVEEYSGFREDVITTLGTRAIPYRLARDRIVEGQDDNRLFVDLWDASYTIFHYGFPSLDEVNSSILFRLKYLTPVEITNWTNSLFQIESPQWVLQMMFSLSQWRSLLTLVRNADKEGSNFQEIVEKSEMLDGFWRLSFKSFDEFIPPANVEAFEQVIAQHLTFDRFQMWKEQVLNELQRWVSNHEDDAYLIEMFEKDAQACEEVLFSGNSGQNVWTFAP
jgi:hypothetical protein